MNMRNFGIAEGRLVRDLTIFENSDGSRKVMMTLAVKDNFESGSDKSRQSQFINLEAFLKPGYKNGVYELIHKGDFIGVQYSVRSNTYVKNGETVYSQILLVESVDIKESKSVTDKRQAAGSEY